MGGSHAKVSFLVKGEHARVHQPHQLLGLQVQQRERVVHHAQSAPQWTFLYTKIIYIILLVHKLSTVYNENAPF